MRISWLAPDEIAAARAALGGVWDAHFTPGFTAPARSHGAPAATHADWARLTEHVARAERVSATLRDQGLAAARARFAGSGVAIEAATLAAAALEDGALAIAEVEALLRCPIDPYVFYAPFLEQLVELGRGDPPRVVTAYEAFAAAHAAALRGEPAHPAAVARTSAVYDALADVYVTTGFLDRAEALFARRHDEDRADVAVALSASRAFLAHGALAQAVAWLGIAAARAADLGRADLAAKLHTKRDAIHRRLS